MQYKELIHTVSTIPMDPNKYYGLLLTNANIIVMETLNTSKKQIAKDLGMSPQVFATAYKFIQAAYYGTK